MFTCNTWLNILNISANDRLCAFWTGLGVGGGGGGGMIWGRGVHCSFLERNTCKFPKWLWSHLWQYCDFEEESEFAKHENVTFGLYTSYYMTENWMLKTRSKLISSVSCLNPHPLSPPLCVFVCVLMCESEGTEKVCVCVVCERERMWMCVCVYACVCTCNFDVKRQAFTGQVNTQTCACSTL